jgi:hypothetical protein
MILISGVGLLLLSMTNRLGRTMDRVRTLAGELETAPPARQAAIFAQLDILWKRAGLARTAITLAAMSALAAALLIIVLFFTALWQMETAWLIAVLFVACLGCLIGSLVGFIKDINQTLAALKLELTADKKEAPR